MKKAPSGLPATKPISRVRGYPDRLLGTFDCYTEHPYLVRRRADQGLILRMPPGKKVVKPSWESMSSTIMTPPAGIADAACSISNSVFLVVCKLS